MATLTPEQTDFLKSHHIPLDKTFDASGLSNKEYKAKMKENGTLVAFGVVPCKEKGHTLRNKQGNCIQCNPQAIASLKRQATTGDVFIAVSLGELVSKIGVVEDASDIANQMNQEHHAGINDWQVALVGHTESIGQMENHLQQRLADRQIPKKLTADSKTTKASGVYDIDIHDAIETLNDSAFTLAHIDNSVIDSFYTRYSQRETERQMQAMKQAEAQAAQEQARIAAQAAEKQAKLDAQKREQQALKEQKLAQKRQRQQEIEAKKRQKQQAKLAAKSHDDAGLVEGVLVATPKPQTSSPSVQPNTPLARFGQPLVWLIGAVIIIIGIAIAAYLFKR